MRKFYFADNESGENIILRRSNAFLQRKFCGMSLRLSLYFMIFILCDTLCLALLAIPVSLWQLLMESGGLHQLKSIAEMTKEEWGVVEKKSERWHRYQEKLQIDLTLNDVHD